MKRYTGYRIHTIGCNQQVVSQSCYVVAEDGGQRYRLPLYLEIRNHSPTGFEWGYGGSGPAQLALALVADAFGVSYAVPSVYQVLKARIVANLPADGWQLTADLLFGAIADQLAERRRALIEEAELEDRWTTTERQEGESHE